MGRLRPVVDHRLPARCCRPHSRAIFLPHEETECLLVREKDRGDRNFKLMLQLLEFFKIQGLKLFSHQMPAK
ncbi:hypothetical protein BHE74_00027439 [Ensete ventricosum]|nr:hypothetical protein BHE74_00027439 [Ensete ventricosum]RZS05342.1 hypothetical protein BHM03_00035838 [Ensete ventricosum]